METTVYFVRHAEPDFSIKEDLIRLLTKTGEEDSKKITPLLLDKNIHVIYSSPYKRSIDTIKDFAEKIQLQVNTHHDFRERKVGTWVEDFETFAKNQWEDLNYKLEQGESLKEVQERNITALFEILDKHQGQNIVVGTHGTALSTMIQYFQSDFGFEQFMEIADKMPYVLCFRFNGRNLLSIEEIPISLEI